MEARGPFLVIGGTGTQGGFTARHLLAGGHSVRVLVRDRSSAKARAIEALGAELVTGDLDDPDSLAHALDGVASVFSVQRPDDGTDSERRHGLGLVKAAYRAGIRHLVHSSVCHAGEHERFPGWAEGRWDPKYWTDKWEIECAVRDAGFPHWTILRPSFILQNLLPPKAAVLYPQLAEGRFLTPIADDAPIQVIAGEDIGAFAAAALLDAWRFGGAIIEMAAETLSVSQMASDMQRVLGKTVTAESVDPDQALAAGQPAKWVRSQEWINEAGYHIDLASTFAWGVPLMTFAAWVDLHRDEFAIASASA